MRAATAEDVPVVIPWRITVALDGRGLYGPEVDEACGVREPAVDRWESGDERPTLSQLERLAELTGYPIDFFTRPVVEGGLHPGPVFICGRGVSGSGIHYPPKPILAPKPDAPFSPEGLW